jgi:choline dehydrogenase-like flavoprotein
MTSESIFGFLRTHKRQFDRVPSRIVRLLAEIGARANRPSAVFSTVLEDLPYTCNHVRAARADDSVEYEYRFPHELRLRTWRLFTAVKRTLESRFRIEPLRDMGALNASHVCGTCRFGNDPAESVLDRNNRAHDLDNLYVVDGSFFPSSGGINPSLTIAANALRVADVVARRL